MEHEHTPITVIDKTSLREYSVVNKGFFVSMNVEKSHVECSECKEVLEVLPRRVEKFYG